jgi:hypothetical protein
MNGCIKWSILVGGVVIAVISGCARQAAPTGGIKDITPPKVVRSNPPVRSKSFNGKRIVVTFNEFIQIDQITDKFIISPPLSKKPNIVVRGKNLEIDFDEKLKDSVTYTLYFQDAVRDLNEGNPLYNYQFVFSTGNIIDSLSVTGNILNASDLEIPGNSIILLYSNLSDSAVAKKMPDYLTFPDKNGGFRINNIREGKYHLYALLDKNNNKRFDLADEGFAFFGSIIEVTKEKNWLPVTVVKDTSKVKGVKKKPPEVPLIDGQYKLFLFTSARKNHYLTSSDRKSAQLLFFTLSLPAGSDDFSLNIPTASEKSYFIEKNPTNDTIMVWLTDSLLYSKNQLKAIINYPFTDTTGFTRPKTDTINMVFNQPRPARATKSKEAAKFSFRTNIPAAGMIAGRPIKFLSDSPFRQPDTSLIHLYLLDKSTKTKVPYSLIKDSLNTRSYLFTAKLREGDSYLIVADRSSFGNIYGAVSDSTGIRFSVRDADSFSKLTLNITDVTGNILIQLLDFRETLISQQRISKDGKVVFSMLDPVKYRVRAVNDLNGDGKWTTGDYWLNQQPEPVTYFPTDIAMKANFDTDQDWSLKNWGLKDSKQRITKEEAK